MVFSVSKGGRLENRHLYQTNNYYYNQKNITIKTYYNQKTYSRTGEGRKDGRKEGRNEGTKEQRNEGRKEGRKEGTNERRNEGTKERRNEGTKERRGKERRKEGKKEGRKREGRKERRNEGRREGKMQGSSCFWLQDIAKIIEDARFQHQNIRKYDCMWQAIYYM